jgi:hypothetical protein
MGLLQLAMKDEIASQHSNYANKVFTSSKCPDWLCGPHNHLFKKYWHCSLMVKQLGLPRIRTCVEIHLCSPVCLPGMDRENFKYVIFNIWYQIILKSLCSGI